MEVQVSYGFTVSIDSLNKSMSGQVTLSGYNQKKFNLCFVGSYLDYNLFIKKEVNYE